MDRVGNLGFGIGYTVCGYVLKNNDGIVILFY